MHVLNQGSRWPTSGVARARYTRGSTEEGPGVSISRTGGANSPNFCVIAFFLDVPAQTPLVVAHEQPLSAAPKTLNFPLSARAGATDKLVGFKPAAPPREPLASTSFAPQTTQRERLAPRVRAG